MLAGRVLIAILDRLLQDATPETLESAAMLLTGAGATFDTPKWPHHEALVSVSARHKSTKSGRLWLTGSQQSFAVSNLNNAAKPIVKRNTKA